MLAFVLAVSAAVALAQPADAVIAVDDGRSSQVLAQRSGSGWTRVDQSGCTNSGSARTITVGGAPAGVPRRITSAAPVWRTLEAAILRVFAQREREHRLTASGLAEAPLSIDWVYAADSGPESVYYFEVSRRVPDPGTAPEEDPKGTLRIAVSGWLRTGASGPLMPLGSKSELRWEQEGSEPATPRPDLRPLGIVGDGEQRIWVMHSEIGTRGRYTLYDVGPETVRRLLEVAAAVCAQERAGGR